VVLVWSFCLQPVEHRFPAVAGTEFRRLTDFQSIAEVAIEPTCRPIWRKKEIFGESGDLSVRSEGSAMAALRGGNFKGNRASVPPRSAAAAAAVAAAAPRSA